jgi:hypothetical protein
VLGIMATVRVICRGPLPLSFLIWLLLTIQCRRGRLLLHLITFNETHTNPHSVELLWTRDPPVTETSNCIPQHSQQTDIHVPGGILTRDPSKWGARTHTHTHTHALDLAATGIGHRLEIREIWRYYLSDQEHSRRLLCDAEHVSNCLNNLQGGTSQNMWPIHILPTVDLFLVILISFFNTPFIHQSSKNYLLCPLTQPSCRCPTNPSL